MIRFSLVVAVMTMLSACSDYVSPRAERVFYRGEDMAAWGTVCRLNQRGFLGFGKRGYVSAAHVTDNGTPLVGPKDSITSANTQSDWSFLGIDPGDLDASDYPAPRQGERVEIHGFPARDRDGEVIPGTLYMDDPQPPFWWVELHDSDDGIAAEGVIGGISGSCVFNGEGRLIAVVHANGFSKIEGTTNTWAKVISVRHAILEAQGRSTQVQTATTTQEPAAQPLPPVYHEVEPVFLDGAPTASAPVRVIDPSRGSASPASTYAQGGAFTYLPRPVAPASARTVASPSRRILAPTPRGGHRLPAPRVCTQCF